MIMRNETMEKARRGEAEARAYLESIGFVIKEQNYRYGRGEIDLIADDRGVTVFVEVKTRGSQSYGAPEFAVTPGKQKQLRRVAEGYIFERRLAELSCRFDVVAVDFHGEVPEIRHTPNAFMFFDR